MSMTIYGQKVALHSSVGVQIFNGINAFKTAYDSSAVGDTIYLSGGSFNVPATIDKKLMIFGAGHYPDSTPVTSKTFLLSGFTLGENADGFHLEGVEVQGTITFTSNKSIDNVIFKYCKINGDLVISGTSNPSNYITIICVVIKNVNLQNAQNVGIYNSIIGGQITNTNYNVIENNIMMYTTTSTSTAVISGNWNFINNNIFLSTSLYINGISNQVRNNIFVASSPNLGTNPITSNNYYPVIQNNIFLNQSGNDFNYSHNYHLQDQDTYLGADDTEVGIYGGVFGYKEGAVPSNPHFQYQNIAPTTDNAGLLPVEIKTSAQDK